MLEKYLANLAKDKDKAKAKAKAKDKVKARDLSLLLTLGCALLGRVCAAAAAPRRGGPITWRRFRANWQSCAGRKAAWSARSVRSYLESVSNRETIVAKIRERADIVDYSGTTWYTSCMGDF